MSGEEAPSIQQQLELAVRDLWTMLEESGDDYVVFFDHRRLHTRVQQRSDGQFSVLWEMEDGSWVTYERAFENPREAAFHGFQGPH